MLLLLFKEGYEKCLITEYSNKNILRKLLSLLIITPPSNIQSKIKYNRSTFNYGVITNFVTSKCNT